MSPPKQTCAAGRGCGDDDVQGQWQERLRVPLTTPTERPRPQRRLGSDRSAAGERPPAARKPRCPAKPDLSASTKTNALSRMWPNSGMWNNRKCVRLGGWEPDEWRKERIGGSSAMNENSPRVLPLRGERGAGPGLTVGSATLHLNEGGDHPYF